MDKEVFTYRVTKNNTVFIDWFGKEVKILKGKDAERFLAKMNAANNQNEEQLIMAEVTGNFKRGNERLGKQNN
ncbi:MULTISPECIES: hypothetical protein [Bacillus]|uniref:Uncharacterized protein n=2 Tax=Bacillus TaxID=1386 RepID=A0A0M4FUX1_9BACI|nr:MULTISPECIES: hypothetical protein [Bacillus]ALC80363.1 hypothetical protein AM592_01165 [Bacillus gobiensis]MBP1083791.1 hypothetical protein [Bacillus capparidis]MED1098276.1 hypothetical protein [Bacillus capparidis]